LSAYIEIVANLQLNSTILACLKKCIEIRSRIESYNITSLLKEDQLWDKNLISNVLSGATILFISVAITAAILLPDKHEWGAWVRLFAATLVGIYYTASYSSEMKVLEKICEISLKLVDWASLTLAGAVILGAQALINDPRGFSIVILTLFLIDSLWVGGILSHYRKELMRNPLLLIKYRWWFVSDFFFIFIGIATTLFLWSLPDLLSFITMLILIISMLHDIWFDFIVINL
jgi:hypothetical protein